jgi:PAS domain S-box-containing protein
VTNQTLPQEILERRRVEQELRESEARVRAILDSALSGVVVMNAEGRIIDWNNRAEAVFGWTRTEALGRELAETIIPPRYREAHHRGLRHYLATGEASVFHQLIEMSALRRDGSEFPMELSISPLKTGDTITFCGFVTDITQRKRAEAALLESQERFRTLAESLPHLVWTCAPDGRCDYLSRQWVEYTGRPEAEQLGYGWAEQMHPDDRERVQAEWAKATDRGDFFDVEFRIRRADGVFRWFKTRAVPLRDGEGHIVKWFGSNTDFEDYKQSEDRLRTQLARLKLLDRTTRAIGERQDLHSIFQVVVRNLEDRLPIDFGCVCLYDPAQETLIVSCIGVKSRPLALEVAMPEQARIDVDANGLVQCVRGQLVYDPDMLRTQFTFQQRLARAGLRSLVVAPLVVERNVFGVMVAARRSPEKFDSADCEFLRQLSEHVALAAHQAQLHSALQRAYDDLRQSQRTVVQQERLGALGQMASGIAHDINNALSPAALYTQSLLEQDASLSDRARKSLAIIQRAIEDVAHTVARMREFYRPHEPQLTLLPVDLNLTLEHVLDLTRARWSDMPQERGIVIRTHTDLAPDLPAILGAKSEISDAVTNLVLNAVDAMPEGGTLTLRSRVVTTQSGGASPTTAVHLEVCDTGVGMDEHARNRCLEPFFTTKGERGTGLGLAMVYGMAQRHGAELEIDSAPGQGTTVRLIFTVVAAAVSPRDQATAELRPTQRLRILVIDDDPMILESLQAVLDADGHVTVVADGGQAGIDSFHTTMRTQERFAAVITDLGMPYVDGRQVASAIKAASPHTPIILLTGWGHHLLATADVPEQVDRVLGKPPKLAELRLALAELTGERALNS